MKPFSISLPSSNLAISLILFTNNLYLQNAIDIADPSSMQDACHMNFVIELAQRRVSVVEHRRFNSSWELRIFSLSHASDKTKHISLYFFTELKTYHLSYPNKICVL